MVSFISLFLGLVLGPQTVAVQVAAPAARVEIHLDGQLAAELHGPLWEVQIDLGQGLIPHELVAVAFDQNHSEVDRAIQWMNLPRQPAETTILLERDDAGQALNARVSWESLVDDQPSAIRAEFDGAPVDFDEPGIIPLPPHDPAELHFLRVEVEFGGIVTSNAEVTFGGTYQDEVNSELTAIPVELTGRRGNAKPTEMEDWFTAREQPLRVAAVEKGPVDLIVVRDRGAWSRLRQVRSEAFTLPQVTAEGRTQAPSTRGQWFQPDNPGWFVWSFQLLWPVPSRRVVGDNPYDLFTHSQKYVGEYGSLHGWLTTMEQPDENVDNQRLADAVAVSAVTAAGSNRRRAVLLVLGSEAEDASEATPEAVRRYLRALGVPLFVWDLDPSASSTSSWGEGEDVSTARLMARASSKIFHQLKRQRIVWVEGKHLPQQVSIIETNIGMQPLARP